MRCKILESIWLIWGSSSAGRLARQKRILENSLPTVLGVAYVEEDDEGEFEGWKEERVAVQVGVARLMFHELIHG